MNKYTKSTQARLEMLERQNRWLTIIAGATILMLLIAATGGPAIMRAMAMHTVDENDNIRAELSLKIDAAGLYLQEEGSLRFYDADGAITHQLVASAADR